MESPAQTGRGAENAEMARVDRPVHARAVVWHRRGPVGDQPEEPRHVARRRSNDRASRTLDRTEAATIVIYVLLAGATILGPLAVYLAMGQRASEILGDWRTWLADNNATVMSVLLLVFAVVLIGQGISGLSG